MNSAPKVLHFNDCASVGRSLVQAASRAGITWQYLPPEKVRPLRALPSNPILAKAAYIPFIARRRMALQSTNVVHVHYGTSVRLIEERGMPQRPYVLTLHGTDIRKQWKDSSFHSEIQRAIDGAQYVYYANTDNIQDALAARADAEFMPSVIDLPRLPSWQPSGVPKIFFISRWDDDKGVGRQLELAAALSKAVDGKAELIGIDWGPGADQARSAGVRLFDRLPQADYYRQLAASTVGVGQASNYFSTSEFEAMAMGLPVAALGSRLPRPDNGTVPPVMEGSVNEVVEQVLAALDDPRSASEKLGGQEWAIAGYDAAKYVPALQELYKKIASA